MTQPKNNRLIRALLKEPVDCTPVWIMRQAGRYLPEYRQTRSQAGDFMALCQNPQLACEVTLQPLERYDLDAAILFSDILTIPDAMGLGLYFEQGEGPKFRTPISTNEQIDKLEIPDPNQSLGYVMDAVRLIRKELNNRVPLIGFSGSPWTLATYMIEGGSSKDFRKIKARLFSDPKSLHLLLDKLAEAVTAYLNAQIQSGAQVVQIFDTWGGVLSPKHYEVFSLYYMKRIIQGLICEHEDNKIPVILFTKQGGQWLELMAQSGADALGLDWCTDIGHARRRVGDKVALQGNLDPCALYGSESDIRHEVAQVLSQYGSGSGHVFNLGHGIHQFVDPSKPKILIDAVHEISAQYHQS